MFGSMKKQERSISGDIETVIGKNTKIKGEVGGTGNLRVDGEIEGSLALTGNVIIGETGLVLGDVKAESLDVSGTVKGNVTAQGALTIHSTGQLIGDVKVNAFQIEDGGIFKGRSEMNLRGESKPAVKSKVAVEGA